jgi:hypothetical protein
MGEMPLEYVGLWGDCMRHRLGARPAFPHRPLVKLHDMEYRRMNVMRPPDEQFPAQDQDLHQRVPVEEIVEHVNAVLRAHGLEAQLTSFSVMHRRFADCTCAEPSAVVSLQGFGRAMSRVEVECYDPCVKLGCSSQEPLHR